MDKRNEIELLQAQLVHERALVQDLEAGKSRMILDAIEIGGQFSDLREAVRALKEVLQLIMLKAPGYDWNTDPLSITLMVGNALTKSDHVLAGEPDEENDSLQAQLTQRTAELEAAANYYKQPSKNGGVYSVSGGHIGNLMDWCKDNLKHCKFSGPDEDNLDLDLVQTAQQIPQLKTELSQLQALVRALVDKLDESDKASQGIFITAAMHGIHYNGPSYADELQALKATLDATTPATTKT